MIVGHLAKWINPFAPDRDTAKGVLTRQLAIFGAPIVQQAYGEMMAQIESGDPIARPIIVFNKICQRIKDRGSKTQVSRKVQAAEEFAAKALG